MLVPNRPESLVRITVLTAACVSTAFLARQIQQVTAYAAQEIQVQPFVAEQFDFYFDEAGKKHVSMYYNVSRRQDGSKLVVQRSPVDGGVTRRVDLANEDFSMINDRVRSRATGRHADVEIAGTKQCLSNPPHACLWEGELPLGEESVAGQRYRKSYYASRSLFANEVD